jgi:hypothetical protein
MDELHNKLGQEVLHSKVKDPLVLKKCIKKHSLLPFGCREKQS